MDKQEVLNMIDGLLDDAANGDGRQADEAGIWNRALITLGRRIDPKFHSVNLK